MSSGRKRGRPRNNSQSISSSSNVRPDGSCRDSKNRVLPTSTQKNEESTTQDVSEVCLEDVNESKKSAESKEKKVRCPKCTFKLRSRYPHKMRLDLFYHIRKVHCGEKCYRQRQACEKCNSLLEQADSLLLDQTHVDQIPKFHYPCYACNRNFARCGSLSDHLSSHSHSTQHRNKHVKELVKHLDEIPAIVQPCFGCGVFYMEKQFWMHLKIHSPSCREKHDQVANQITLEKEETVNEGNDEVKEVRVEETCIESADQIGKGRDVEW